MVPQVCFEAKGLDDRQQRLDQVDGRAGPQHVLCHVAAPLAEHIVDCADAICAVDRKQLPSTTRFDTSMSSCNMSVDVCATSALGTACPGVHGMSRCAQLQGSMHTCWSLDLDIVHGLHEARGGHEERGVADAAGRGDELPAAPRQRLIRNGRVHDLELHVADGLVAQRPLPRPPLEALRSWASAQNIAAGLTKQHNRVMQRTSATRWPRHMC
jgi:hypothetical protein